MPDDAPQTGQRVFTCRTCHRAIHLREDRWQVEFGDRYELICVDCAPDDIDECLNVVFRLGLTPPEPKEGGHV